MEREKKNEGFFGRDLSQIPCFRQTFLYSITAGLGSGALYFLLTSRVQRATQIALGTFTVVTLGYWSYCRYNYSVQKFESGKLQRAIQQQAAFEGTEMESKIKANK